MESREVYLDNGGGSVLLADEIKRLCEDPETRMITPFEGSRLRPASYQLTLGREAHIGGRHYYLHETEPMVLEPHQVAVVTTAETVRIPRFLIARWSLRVQKIYEGLLWTGGPQVDPGWVGCLPCPIYNLAERGVELRLGDPLFTIDFVRTTGVTDEYLALTQMPGYSKTWFTAVNLTLAEHDTNRLHSAPYESLRELGELTQFRNFSIAALSVQFVILAVVITALTIVTVQPVANPGGKILSGWPMTALVIAIVALVFSVVAVSVPAWRFLRRWMRNSAF